MGCRGCYTPNVKKIMPWTLSPYKAEFSDRQVITDDRLLDTCMEVLYCNFNALLMSSTPVTVPGHHKAKSSTCLAGLA